MKSFVKNNVKFLLILLSVCLIIVGIELGQPNTVWQKAIIVCLECCGIG